MKPHATLWERFEGWFLMPIQKLKECPDGAELFLAMSAGLFLCERYYRTMTNTHEGKRDDSTFRIAAAKDLGIKNSDFEIFWNVFRHGIQHQGMPKCFRDAKSGIEYRWNIGIAFQALPMFCVINPKLHVIVINPWAFAEMICQKYRNNPTILQNATVHVFGEAYS